jgi:hypothetical protein
VLLESELKVMKLELRCLSDREEIRWDSFVKNCAKGTFFHTTKWKKILESSFLFESIYLMFEDRRGNLVGVCPFVIKRRFWPFVSFHSLPDSEFGGPLAESKYDEVVSYLVPCLKKLAHEKSATYAVIRCSDEKSYGILVRNALMVNRSYGTMELDLEEKPVDFIWNNVFNKANCQRKYIKRFIHDGFQNREAKNKEDFKEFYALYRENMSYIGVPFYPFLFFDNIYNIAFPDNFNIILAKREEKCIGGLGFFIYGNTIYLTYLGLDRNVPLYYHTSYYLYWGAIEWAQKNGIRYVNFGGTPSNVNSPYFRLKKKFGTEFRQRYLIYIPLVPKFINEHLLRGIKKLKEIFPERSIQSLKASIPN